MEYNACLNGGKTPGRADIKELKNAQKVQELQSTCIITSMYM